MKRRRLLLGASALLPVSAGCNGTTDENGTDTPTESPTKVPTTTATATDSPAPTATETPSPTPERKTPTEDFARDWILEEDDDWVQHDRALEYPDSHESVDWTPEYAVSEEFSHEPSREALVGALGASDVPPVAGAVVCKVALPADFSGTGANLVAELPEWFERKVNECAVTVEHQWTVEPFAQELDSGKRIGWYPFVASGDSGQLEAPLPAAVDDDTVEVERITFEAEALYLGLVDEDEQLGYLVVGGWPEEDTVTLHTVDDEEIDVSASVRGEAWDLEDTLVDVLEDVDQN